MKNRRTTPESTATTCPYCGVGCGVLAKPDAVQGDVGHPANNGRLCVKGSALHETVTGHDRLLAPRVAGHNVEWSEAIDRVAEAIRVSVRDHGPESVAFYLSGQLLTEDYYIANKLAKGFIGTPHVDTNSRLCMSSAVAAHKRAFGEDCVPGCYEDLELADLLVLAGSNAAWTHPVLYQRIKASHRSGRNVVAIDPRQTATTEMADLHLQLRPGTDTLLFNGLLVWLNDHGALAAQYLEQHCNGFEETLSVARACAPSIMAVARGCDLRAVDVERFYRWFAETDRTVSAFSQGINQSVAGTDKANAIINCHLATGRVGRPGAGPFSLTGQPNAMGGREVGGLANTLAAHMDYDTPGAVQRVADFWHSEKLAAGPGYKAVDLFEAVHRGDIRVLWVMGTNPAVSLPDSARVREALARCETLIVSDCVAQTDTTAFADILLPAAGWGEKDGTVTNSERCISRQRRFLPVPEGVRPDWRIIRDVAQALGYGHTFDYQEPAEIFREHAALSGYGNGGERVFDISALATLSSTEYDQLQPVQWPLTGGNPGAWLQTRRLFSDGRFPTPDGRARLVPVSNLPPGQQPDARHPLIVNTGRIRDQWHTMTRTARAPRLFAHRSEPFIEVHPKDIATLGLIEGALATLTGPARKGFTGRVRASPAQRPGEVFVPIHWNRQFASSALASDLIAPVVDPISGQPEAKCGVATLRPLITRWQARLMLPAAGDTALNAASLDYWSHQAMPHSRSWWLAGRRAMDWREWARQVFAREPELVMQDGARRRFRAAWLTGNRLDGVLLVEPCVQSMPDLGWLDDCFGAENLTPEQRRSLLAAGSVDEEPTGPLVCSCFQVGERQINQAIEDGAASVEALGQRLQCGRNCGSCIPEIRGLLAKSADREPA
ncbi:MAG: molybdopterin-dependent oxidoreductase [Marinobacter sp.]|uniref:nitrate reductase n=1 Tax=Marinobacter sp. TaxID=50741 RepID=UPI0029C23096|nr:molybdopterin-dependent oxidoreductase [Marinobacter sp.]MDX5335486.1 molybdopterin-dependent oxidoreductase [Marinobacter sp.]MDX5386301.1 molybdopterin-dependent oxidoreductase [Marinobacter sp.]MDX5442020.1 molybdopterin-dependent oxidoreductase [Alteromonadaceae bacterium]MDX5471803.1 molybdopterin-dependent oxidoreductase [Marinobacter sp.]